MRSDPGAGGVGPGEQDWAILPESADADPTPTATRRHPTAT
jgi:hypothetical protein